MDRERQLLEELRVLRSLCDERSPIERRRQAADSLRTSFFIEPEHQIVFESVRALFQLGPITAENLRVHLTRRGFPDTDVESYFSGKVND